MKGQPAKGSALDIPAELLRGLTVSLWRALRGSDRYAVRHNGYKIPVKSRIAVQTCAILSCAPGSDRGYALLVRRFRGGGFRGGPPRWGRSRSGGVGRGAGDLPPETAAFFPCLLGGR